MIPLTAERIVNHDEIEDVLAGAYDVLKKQSNAVFAERFIKVKDHLLESERQAGILRLFLEMFGEKTPTELEMKIKYAIGGAGRYKKISSVIENKLKELAIQKDKLFQQLGDIGEKDYENLRKQNEAIASVTVQIKLLECVQESER